jgi:hypothetical protein
VWSFLPTDPRRTWWCLNRTVIVHDFDQLLTAYPRDTDGTPLGPSRFGGTPYWQTLFATVGLLAAGAAIITLTAAPSPASCSRHTEQDVPRD